MIEFEEFDGTINHLYQGCPKYTGWFGCRFIKDGESTYIRLMPDERLRITDYLSPEYIYEGQRLHVKVRKQPYNDKLSGLPTYAWVSVVALCGPIDEVEDDVLG